MEVAAANEVETSEETDSQTVADAADGDAGDAALPLSDAVPGTAGIAAEDFSVQSVSEEETGNETGQTPSLEIGGSEVNLSEGGSGEG